MTRHRPLAVIGGSIAAFTLVLVLGQVQTGPAAAIPADNGDVKIHSLTTAYTDQRNDPKVSDFYLAAFNFDPGQTVSYWFVKGTPFKGPRLLAGSITVDAAGNGHTGALTLDEGIYKLFFKPVGAHGADKFKVFKVALTPGPTPSPTPSPTVTPTPEPTGEPTPKPTATSTPPFTGGGGGITPGNGGTSTAGGGTLPRTGRDVTALTLGAGLSIATGMLLLALGRRRTKLVG